MTASLEDFRRLEELYHRLADLAPGERGTMLAELQAADPDLHARLGRLLARDGEAVERSLLDATAATAAPPEPRAGDRIGPYRLLRPLGEGGMGVVFEAEQEAPLRRRVALKLVRGGLAGARVAARFESERSTLARMAHPGIAQVFDAGTAPDGRPYFVMERVEGEPITAFCDRRRLSTRERIALVQQVCDAVRHAHQKGILHRDLKPSNLLVTTPAGEPRVEVIDFGIAKLTSEEPAGDGLTRLGEIVGTPEYMSPEQTGSGGADVDTRSDVYSLGVVLYELLTGRLPIDRDALRAASPVEVARLVGDRPPTPPSARLARVTAEIVEIAARRATDPARLKRELRGDLGRIVMMALRKEPERRYGSVEQLAADLDRYLRGHPVAARPDSLAYRTAKLVRRHRVAAAAAALLALGLVAASVLSTAMYLRADAARRESEVQRVKAERIGGFLTTTLSSIDPEIARGRDVSVLRQVLDDAAARIDAELAALPEVAAELQLTVGRAYWSIGLEEEAERRLRASLATWRASRPPRPAERAEAELALGVLLRVRARYEEAEALLRGVVETGRALDPPDEPALAAALTALARLLEETGGYAEAESLYREALAIERRRPEPDVEALATTLRGFGQYLMNQNRMDEAEASLREAVEIRRAAPGSARASLVLPLLTLARWFRWSERWDEAEERMREAVEISRSDLPPEHPQRHEVTSELANLRQQRGAPAEAEALYREALEAQLRVHGEGHTGVGTTLNNLGSLLHQVGRHAEGEELFGEAEAAYRTSLGDGHYWVSIVLFNRGRSLFELGRFEEAEAALTEAGRIRAGHESAAWQRAEIEVWRAACRVERGDLSAEVETALTEGIAALVAQHGEATERAEVAHGALARLHERTGRLGHRP